jgi:hypothetical protein
MGLLLVWFWAMKGQIMKVDLSGLCDAHGIAVFCTDDAMAEGTAIETKTLCEGEPAQWPPIWYWATHQHGALTGKPNGPFNSRAMALANAAFVMAAVEYDVILADVDLGP